MKFSPEFIAKVQETKSYQAPNVSVPDYPDLADFIKCKAFKDVRQAFKAQWADMTKQHRALVKIHKAEQATLDDQFIADAAKDFKFPAGFDALLRPVLQHTRRQALVHGWFNHHQFTLLLPLNVKLALAVKVSAVREYKRSQRAKNFTAGLRHVS